MDLERVADELNEAAFSLGSPNEATRRSHGHARIAKAREALARARIQKTELREALWPPDEEDA